MRDRPLPIKIGPAADEPRSGVQRIMEKVLLAGGQLLISGALAIMWKITADALGWTEARQFPRATAGPQILTACIIAVLGFYSARLIVRLLPSAIDAGLWVWLPPTALLSLLIGLDVLRYHTDWHSISTCYFWTYPYRKIGPIERDMLTYPTLSAIAYSLGILVHVLQCRRVGQG